MEIEKVKTKKSWLKSKWFWGIVGPIILLIIIGNASYSSGYNDGKEAVKGKVDGNLVTYNKLESLTKSEKANYDKLKSNYDKLNSDYTSKSTEFDKALALSNKTDELKQQISDSEDKLNSLKSDIKGKEGKLSSLTGQIVKAKGSPKTLGAGQYVVGKDIPAGRYKAHALGRGSNFFVYDSDGSPSVNTILGNAGGIGSGDYTFFCDDGNIIETDESVQLIPVK